MHQVIQPAMDCTDPASKDSSTLSHRLGGYAGRGRIHASKVLHRPLGFVFVDTHCLQRMSHHTQRQLALAHQSYTGTRIVQEGRFLVAMRARKSVDIKIHMARPPYHLTSLKTAWSCDYQKARAFYMRSLQHTR